MGIMGMIGMTGYEKNLSYQMPAFFVDLEQAFDKAICSTYNQESYSVCG